jgi:hypothetical protein
VAKHQRSRIKKKLALRKVEAKVVRLIFDLFLNGNEREGTRSIGQLVAWLKQNGCHASDGSEWNTRHILRVLSNPIYKGEYCYRPAVAIDGIRVSVPAIISAEIFVAVQLRVIATEKSKKL